MVKTADNDSKATASSASWFSWPCFSTIFRTRNSLFKFARRIINNMIQILDGRLSVQHWGVYRRWTGTASHAWRDRRDISLPGISTSICYHSSLMNFIFSKVPNEHSSKGASIISSVIVLIINRSRIHDDLWYATQVFQPCISSFLQASLNSV